MFSFLKLILSESKVKLNEFLLNCVCVYEYMCVSWVDKER